jgi:hypothetical protein
VTRSVYAKDHDGTWRWFECEGKPAPEVNAPFVHQDSFKTPLKHPKTGEMVESLTRWNQINRAHKLDVVGNDLHSKQKRLRPEDRVPDSKIMDALAKAEAIHDDPSKRRAWQEDQRERIALYQERRAGGPIKVRRVWD